MWKLNSCRLCWAQFGFATSCVSALYIFPRNKSEIMNGLVIQGSVPSGRLQSSLCSHGLYQIALGIGEYYIGGLVISLILLHCKDLLSHQCVLSMDRCPQNL